MAKDTDQILSDDMKSQAAIDALKNQKFDEYLPGLGKHYCIPCAKYYESDVALTSHQKSKIHKRQLKNIRFGPYTQEEAASGSGRDVEKYLAKQQELQSLLQSESANAQLTVAKGQQHKKSPQKTGKGEMDIEEDVETGEAESQELPKASPQEEITV